MGGTQDKQKLRATVSEEAKILDLLNKEFTSTILYIAKDLQETKGKKK